MSINTRRAHAMRFLENVNEAGAASQRSSEPNPRTPQELRQGVHQLLLQVINYQKLSAEASLRRIPKE